MSEMQKLAKAVVTTALFDLVKIRSSKDFKYCGTPYIDNKDHLLWSKIKPKNIDKNLLDWFDSDSREQFSYQYWLGYSGMNPNAIRKYVKQLRLIVDGISLEDEKEIEVDRYAEPDPPFIAKGYLPYVKVHPRSHKWINV